MSADDLARRLRALEDIEAIRSLKARYLACCDRKDPAGMRARLTFAMSMALQFRCYLIDELTAVGDMRFREKCQETFAARRETADVIIVSHQLGTIRTFADSAAVLHDGELLFFENVDDAIYYYNHMP